VFVRYSTSHAGKTILLRDVARLLAQNQHVCIVDTSNKIGGESDVPHLSIGEARRMMVTSISAQPALIERCIQVRFEAVSAVCLNSACHHER
jgi:stage III sporulation protein SpoIIIAA